MFKKNVATTTAEFESDMIDRLVEEGLIVDDTPEKVEGDHDFVQFIQMALHLYQLNLSDDINAQALSTISNLLKSMTHIGFNNSK